MENTKKIPMQKRLLVESLKQIFENESADLDRDDIYQALDKEQSEAEKALRELIKDRPDICNAFTAYCETRTSRESFEEEAMFFAGYGAALSAIGEYETKMHVLFAKLEMDRERAAS